MNLSEIIAAAGAWSNERQLTFCDHILGTISLSIRHIWSDQSSTAEDKIEAMKWLNEFTHRVQNIVVAFETSLANTIIQDLDENIKFYANENATVGAVLHGIIKLAYEKTERIPAKTFKDYSPEYLVFHQALNEVCHGAYALPEWEFETLMGVTKKEAIKMLNSEKDPWKTK